MPIETKGSMTSILKNLDGKNWVKKARIEPSDVYKKLGTVKNGSFQELLKNYIGEVNNLQTKANHEIEKLVTGKSKNIHETMLAVEKAEIAFKTINQIRLKVIDAYKEIMKMQV